MSSVEELQRFIELLRLQASENAIKEIQAQDAGDATAELEWRRRKARNLTEIRRLQNIILGRLTPAVTTPTLLDDLSDEILAFSAEIDSCVENLNQLIQYPDGSDKFENAKEVFAELEESLMRRRAVRLRILKDVYKYEKNYLAKSQIALTQRDKFLDVRAPKDLGAVPLHPPGGSEQWLAWALASRGCRRLPSAECVAADGNCQFDSIRMIRDAEVGNKVVVTADDYRKVAVEWLAKYGRTILDGTVYAAATTTEDGQPVEFEEYLQQMATTKKWGDNLTLVALAERLRAEFTIFDATNGVHDVVIVTPHTDASDPLISRTRNLWRVYLIRVNGNHYEPAQKIKVR